MRWETCFRPRVSPSLTCCHHAALLTPGVREGSPPTTKYPDTMVCPAAAPFGQVRDSVLRFLQWQRTATAVAPQGLKTSVQLATCWHFLRPLASSPSWARAAHTSESSTLECSGLPECGWALMLPMSQDMADRQMERHQGWLRVSGAQLCPRGADCAALSYLALLTFQTRKLCIHILLEHMCLGLGGPLLCHRPFGH